MRIDQIAQLVGAIIDGDPRTEIVRPSAIEDARSGDITFLANSKYVHFVSTTQASAILVREDFVTPEGSALNFLRVKDPYLAFLIVMKALLPPQIMIAPGIHPSAVVAPTAVLGKDVRIGANAVIGERVRIGDRTVISHGCVIGDDCVVGSDSLLHSSVTIREACSIGSEVILQPGVVIGGDGFGFAPKPDGSYEKIPQLGTVVIEDGVELGANTTVDRATMGETRIGQGVKLDNLIQIAHNVTIGHDTVMAAQSGVAGSAKIGANCIFAGQTAVVGHISVADRTILGGQSGINHTIDKPGQTLFGSPAIDHRKMLRVTAATHQLPDVLHEIRALKSEVEALRKELEELRSKSESTK